MFSLLYAGTPRSDMTPITSTNRFPESHQSPLLDGLHEIQHQQYTGISSFMEAVKGQEQKITPGDASQYMIFTPVGAFEKVFDSCTVALKRFTSTWESTPFLLINHHGYPRWAYPLLTFFLLEVQGLQHQSVRGLQIEVGLLELWAERRKERLIEYG